MQKLGRSQYLGYAAGDAANNLSFSMVTGFLILYYTDVIGAEAAAIATLIFVVRFWDALADLFAGQLVDKTMTRWGKFRPFFLFGSLPLLLSSIACFSVPSRLSMGQKMLWAYGSYALMGLLYSLVNIPYGSLAAAMTQVSSERAKLAAFRVGGSTATMMLIALVVSPQVQSNKGNASGLQHALTVTTILFGVIGLALYAYLFRSAKEQVLRVTAHVRLRDSLKVAMGNGPLLMLCGSSLLFLTAMFLGQALGVYYARDVLGNANYYIYLSVTGSLSMVLASTTIPRIVRSIGKKRGYQAFGVLAVVGGLLLWQAPTPRLWAGETASVVHIVVPLLGWAVYNLGVGGVNTLMWALEADTVEYGEWKTDTRIEGLTYSMFSFTRKMGQAIGGSIGVAALGYFAYNKDAASLLPHGSQTEATINGMKMGIGLFPALVIVLATVAMGFYRLTDTRFAELMDDLRARRAAKAMATAAG